MKDRDIVQKANQIINKRVLLKEDLKNNTSVVDTSSTE